MIDLAPALNPPRAWGHPPVLGNIRQQPSDFRVDEQLANRPDGREAHRWFRIQKTGTNTQWLTRQIARACGIRNRDVGYAGLKDRNAVTSQWLSVAVEHANSAEQCLETLADISIMERAWHSKKLRPGTPLRNAFTIIVREPQFDAAALEARLRMLDDAGCPNYYGPQRFGHNGKNIETALATDGRKPAGGIGLSALRSLLFNAVLAERVTHNTWRQRIAGDAFALHGSGSVFADDASDALAERLHSGDLHIAGTLYGQGRRITTAAAGKIEDHIWQQHAAITSVLDTKRLALAHRPLRLLPEDLGWQAVDDALRLRFTLAAGAYATTVLREILDPPPKPGCADDAKA